MTENHGCTGDNTSANSFRNAETFELIHMFGVTGATFVAAYAVSAIKPDLQVRDAGDEHAPATIEAYTTWRRDGKVPPAVIVFACGTLLAGYGRYEAAVAAGATATPAIVLPFTYAQCTGKLLAAMTALGIETNKMHGDRQSSRATQVKHAQSLIACMPESMGSDEIAKRSGLWEGTAGKNSRDPGTNLVSGLRRIHNAKTRLAKDCPDIDVDAIADIILDAIGGPSVHSLVTPVYVALVKAALDGQLTNIQIKNLGTAVGKEKQSLEAQAAVIEAYTATEQYVGWIENIGLHGQREKPKPTPIVVDGPICPPAPPKPPRILTALARMNMATAGVRSLADRIGEIDTELAGLDPAAQQQVRAEFAHAAEILNKLS